MRLAWQAKTHPWKVASPLLAGANQRENYGGIRRLFLVTSVWANQVVAELNGLQLVKKRGTGVDCSPAESPELNLEDGVGELRGLLLLLL